MPMLGVNDEELDLKMWTKEVGEYIQNCPTQGDKASHVLL